MSRAYRIQISESVERIVHVEDGVATTLELLPILGKERMKEILGGELQKRGFSKKDGKLRRVDDNTTVEVDPATGEVKVSVTRQQDIEVKATRDANVDRDHLQRGKEAAEAKLRGELEREVDRREEALRREATKELEGKLRDLRDELDKVVNRTTAEALKERARAMGEIEEISEDQSTGNMTIKVRV